MFIDLTQYGKEALFNTEMTNLVDLSNAKEKKITLLHINGKMEFVFKTVDEMDEFVSNFTGVRGKYK